VDRAKDPRWFVRGIVAFCVGAALVSAVQGAMDRRPGIGWQTDFSLAHSQARRTGHPMMVVFEAAWCGWCARMDRQVFRDRGVVHASRQFVCVRLDATKRPDLLSQYGGNAVPFTAFLAPDGTPVGSVAGYVEADEMERAMIQAAQRSALHRPM